MSTQARDTSTMDLRKKERVSRLRRWLPSLVLLVVSIAFSLVLAEIFLRVIGYRVELQQIGHPVLGLYVGKPHAREFTAFPEYKGGGILTYLNNRSFFQDEDTNLVKKPGVIRVAIMGDSQTAGAGVNSESYAHVLQVLMNARGREQYEMLNGGTGKYSPYQYYLRVLYEMAPLKPDRVIIAIYIGNDLQDLIRRDDRPYLTLNPDGSIRQHPPEFVVAIDPATQNSFLAQSRLLGLVRATLGPTLMYQFTRARALFHNLPRDAWSIGNFRTVWRYTQEIQAVSRNDRGLVTQDLNQDIWFQYFPNTLPTALTLNRHLMDLFKDMARKYGFQLTYLLIPTKVQIEPDDLAEDFDRLSRFGPELTLEKVRTRNNALTDTVLIQCRQDNIDVVDPRQELIERRAGRRLYYRKDMHLNVAGARLIAEILAEHLSKEVPAPNATPLH